jgi:hypothetical protein
MRGLLVRGMLGVLVLLRGLRVTRGESKNWLVDHDIKPYLSCLMLAFFFFEYV